MGGNTPPWLVLVGFIVTVVGSWGATKLAGRSAVQVAKVGADEGAFVRAEQIYQSAITRLEKENADLRAEVEALKTRVAELEHPTA